MNLQMRINCHIFRRCLTSCLCHTCIFKNKLKDEKMCYTQLKKNLYNIKQAYHY